MFWASVWHYCICPLADTRNGVSCVCLRQNMCVPYLTLEARSIQTNYTIWISTLIYSSMHSFRLKTVPGCHYNSCSKSQFCFDWLTPTSCCSEQFPHSLDTLCSCCTLICAYCNRGQRCFFSFGDWSPSLIAALEFDCECFLSSSRHSNFSLTHAQQICFTHALIVLHVVALARSRGQDTS